jgi:hypothetical protein
MNQALATRHVVSATAFGGMAVLVLMVAGCASPTAVGEPQVEPPPPPPVVAPASGPPPDYVQPTNYWVREKIILTSEQEPPKASAQKSPAKKGKKSKETGT